MSLTERVSFKNRLQRGNRVQVPKYVRWNYKLETTQILQVTVSILGAWRPAEFSIKNKQRRKVVITELTITLFKDGKPNIDGYVADVRLVPL